MASRFWVGGTGSWDAVTTLNWSATSGGAGGASVPGAADDVTLNGSSGGGVVTITAPVNVLSITMGAFTGTVRTNIAGVSPQPVTVSTLSNTGTSTRTLDITNSTLTVTAATGVVWTQAVVTGLTFTVSGSVIALTGNGARTFNPGATTYATVNVTGSGAVTFGTTSAVFGTLTRTSTAVQTDSLVFSSNQTITGNFTPNGNSTANRLTVNSNILGTPRTITLTGATVNSTNVDYNNVVFTGSPTQNVSSCGDLSGNTGVTFSTPVTRFWVGDGGNASDPATHWAATSGGSAGAANFPLAQDTWQFDANSFTTSGQTVALNIQRIGSLNFTGINQSITVTTPNSVVSYGSLVTNPNVVASPTGTFSIGNQTVTQTITSNGGAWNMGFTIVTPGAVATLNDNFLQTLSPPPFGINISMGTLNLNGFDMTVGSFASGGALARTINLGSGTLTLFTQSATPWNPSGSNLTLNAGTSTIKYFANNGVGSSVTRTLALNGLVYNNIWIAETGASSGQITITGSATVNQFRIDARSAAWTLALTSGITLTMTSAVGWSGMSGAVLTINAVTPTSAANLSMATGTLNVRYTTITDNIPAGGATWNAYQSTNGGNTTGTNGWNFFPGPPPGTGGGGGDLLLRVG